MSRITVQPEGREGIYVPDRASLKAFLIERGLPSIHNFTPAGACIVGADHSPESVLDDIDRAVRLALVTGEALRSNLNHALALVMPAEERLPVRLEVYDIGPITDAELNVEGNANEAVA